MKENIKQRVSEYLTTGIVAQYCGVSYVTVLRWIRKGYLPAFRLPSGHYRVIRADFDEFLARHGIPSRSCRTSVRLERTTEGIEEACSFNAFGAENEA